MFDATCGHPLNGFPPIDYDAPACPHFEPEELARIM